MMVELDNRGLTSPEPMVRILRALRTLPPDDCLLVKMDREPLLLYPELERRGFVSTITRAAGEDGYILVIGRPAGAGEVLA